MSWFDFFKSNAHLISIRHNNDNGRKHLLIRMKYITNYFSFCTLAHSEDLIEKKVNDYGHEIPQSHTADLPTTP